MTDEDPLKLARIKLSRAEEALDTYLHGREYDHEQVVLLVEEVSSARRILLDHFSLLRPSHEAEQLKME